MTRKLAYLALAGMIALLPACRDNKQAGGKKYFVAFSQCNNAEPYRAAQNQLMEKLFRQKGDVQLVIADAQQDNSKQIAQIETFIRQKPDLLIVAPNERAPLTEVMGRAMAAGIPVICLERDITQPNYTTFIGADNLAIGKMAGQFIVDSLNKKYGKAQGKIVEIRGLLGVEAEMERYNGAHDVLKDYPNIKVVHEAVADWLQSNARERMAEILRAQPEIDVVYAHNDPMAVGAYLAAHDLGRDKQMIFIGVDGLGGPAGGVKKVMDGVLAATFYYPLCVDKAVEVGEQILHDPNFHADKQYILKPELITAANANEFYQKLTF
ncbi:MAG TPA: substrate-binding domain-containing protein [Candidatus Sulfotelmatobacter sp.]|nr:substrate-binding domain-containing protein [Candidatus Sulfotelmatobacter sp.]